MKQTKSQRLKAQAFREVRRSEPARVAQTRATKGDAAAEQQLRAIAFDEARRRGARLPRRKS